MTGTQFPGKRPIKPGDLDAMVRSILPDFARTLRAMFSKGALLGSFAVSRARVSTGAVQAWRCYVLLIPHTGKSEIDVKAATDALFEKYLEHIKGESDA
jgi:hypothetical protein